MSFYLCFNWDLVTVCKSKIQLKKACWILLFNSILAEVKFPVVVVVVVVVYYPRLLHCLAQMVGAFTQPGP